MAEDSQEPSTLGSQRITEESDLEHIEPRQATLFLIDTTRPMFEEDPQTEESPFMKSILTYKNNLQMLCGFNRDDWCSLILFGTNEWDQDPETKNVLTVQKFQKVGIEMLKEIVTKIDNYQNSFNQLSSSTYPLHDALWHAAQAFSGVKTVIIARKIVLLTCEDNPFAEDPNERHRIRTRVSTFKNLGIDLRVIGLKNDFDHEKFYKELEIIASGIDPQTYKKPKLEDLEAEIQFPSRNISTIFWRFGKDVFVPVSIFSVSTGTKYPDSVYINRTTNEPLKSFTMYKKKENEDDEDEEEEVQNDEAFNSKVVAAGGLAKFQVHGEKKLVFDVKEISTMFDQFAKGIETICFKPIECDPMYHVDSPKFLSFHLEEASESQREFFTTLLNKCEAKELMAVCRITYRLHASPGIFYFYPSVKKGGFFIYKMAYEDQVRNLDSTLSNWMYDDDDNWKHWPSEGAVRIFEKIIKKTRIRFDPSLFKNPKLETLIANIEALALDLNETNLPADSTLPSRKIEERLNEIMPEYYKVFPQEDEFEPPAKRMKPSVDTAEMRKLVLMKQVENCTVQQLKDFLKEKRVAIPTFCRKADCVKKVYEFYRTN